MKGKQWLGVVALLLATLVLATAQGAAPRATANKYRAHAEEQGASIGAARLNAGQLRKVFGIDKATSADMDDCCVVLEVALYPSRDGKLEVNLADFALRVSGEEKATKPSDPKTVVAQLPYSIQVGESGHSGLMADAPPQLDSRNGGVYHDPVTGAPRRTDGYPSRGADIGASPISSTSRAEGFDERHNLELRLAQKALPEGTTAAPVAGYIYFSVAKQKNANYELEYKLNGKTVLLPL